MITRREFLVGSACAAGLAALSGCRDRDGGLASRIPGEILGANSAAGHRLRTGALPPVSETIEAEFVVLGGGVAGLSAARQLRRSGVNDLLLLELEDEIGGNARSGSNAVSAYPWGAHYLPLPSEESVEVAAWLEEIGLITGRAADGAPIFDEYALCADPMERLFHHGAWQEGIVPRLDVPHAERAQIEGFLARMDRWRTTRGSDGRRAFAIPVDRSSRDTAFLDLDRVTMADYLKREGWTSEALRWYVDYCCRDDYGASADAVSAWAGIHYFASRNARAANAPSSAVLTWPEGNGWLARQLQQAVGTDIRPKSLVWSIDCPPSGGVAVDFLDLASERSIRVKARGAVCALPRFIAQRLIHGGPGAVAVFPDLVYSPWMVANLTLRQLPGSTSALAWDNVPRESRSLGYVVATHQSLASHPRKTVITYYQPLDDVPPQQARETALARTHESWAGQILADLQRMHPDLPAQTARLDVWLWGHAMIRPVPGFISGPTRRRMQAPHGPLAFAHSDMSGISIFEEAFTRGIDAANTLLASRKTLSPA
ncbi:FAD-dependent oxidoreductase [Opitutaceae bacterium EW11]|nr:FAD-dependent oxidoreductase [Opitutaceae bacterium EW11]